MTPEETQAAPGQDRMARGNRAGADDAWGRASWQPALHERHEQDRMARGNRAGAHDAWGRAGWQPALHERHEQPQKKERGFLLGLVYGLVPHTFCILFIALSIIGATAATSVIQRFLLIPYFFQLLVALSLVFATISSLFYLRRNGLLSLEGIRFKWKYLTVMFGTTVGINLLFFWVILPAVAGVDFQKNDIALAAPPPATQQAAPGATPLAAPSPAQAVTLEVDIPCPGHAPLISSELKKVDGITAVKYGGGRTFRVSYDPNKLTVDKILALDIFQYFPARPTS